MFETVNRCTVCQYINVERIRVPQALPPIHPSGLRPFSGPLAARGSPDSVFGGQLFGPSLVCAFKQFRSPFWCLCSCIVGAVFALATDLVEPAYLKDAPCEIQGSRGGACSRSAPKGDPERLPKMDPTKANKIPILESLGNHLGTLYFESWACLASSWACRPY